MKERHLVFGLFAFCILYRFVPHVANFSPLLAYGIFMGHRSQQKYGFALPVILMMISDFFLGLYPGAIFTYIGLASAIFWGHKIICPSRGTLARVTRTNGASLLGVGSFFLISNFGVWLTSDMYTKDIHGVFECYLLAIPFLKNSLLGTLIYSNLFLTLQQFCQHEARTWQAQPRVING